MQFVSLSFPLNHFLFLLLFSFAGVCGRIVFFNVCSFIYTLEKLTFDDFSDMIL